MKRHESLSPICTLAILVAIFVLRGNAIGAGVTEKVLYSFSGGPDGASPLAGLVMDAQGNLYGTTADGGNGHCQGGCGTVFELSPNPDGTWTETQLYSFTGGSDGAFPETNVIFDAAGNLYGTTIYGGTSKDGTVFRLAPTKPGSAWTETVLYNFIGKRDGKISLGGLVFDPAGRPASDLAHILKLSKATIFRMTAQGRIPVLRIGASLRFDPAQIAAWLRERAVRG